MSSVVLELDTRGKTDMERDIQKNTERQSPRSKEQASKPVWVLASCWEQSGGSEWERCWLVPSSSGPPSWENCPPLSTRQVSGRGHSGPRRRVRCSHQEHGQVLTSWQTLFVWALERNKYHLAGWALRIFYIINKGLQGLRFSLSLNRMISHIIFTMAFSCF